MHDRICHQLLTAASARIIHGDPFSAEGIGLTVGDTFLHAFTLAEQSLHFRRIDVHAAADDHVILPSQNVQRCYWEYRRRDTAEKKLREQIAAGEAELAYIESVTDLLDRAGSEADLTAIR